MLDNLILETVALHSYNESEIKSINATSDHLREMVRNKSEFSESQIGGSFKKGTVVKGMSDVDIYFQYIGSQHPAAVLSILKTYLIPSYRNTEIRRDKPSILVDFQKIPFNITPFKREGVSSVISIPDQGLNSWRPVDLSILERGINLLAKKNPKYLDLVKILKLWNKNHSKKLQNFQIEERVITFFLPSNYEKQSISDWMLLFFKNYAFHNDSVTMVDLKSPRLAEAQLRSLWKNFIDNK